MRENLSFFEGTTPGEGKLINYKLRDEAVNIMKWELLGTVF